MKELKGLKLVEEVEGVEGVEGGEGAVPSSPVPSPSSLAVCTWLYNATTHTHSPYTPSLPSLLHLGSIHAHLQLQKHLFWHDANPCIVENLD